MSPWLSFGVGSVNGSGGSGSAGSAGRSVATLSWHAGKAPVPGQAVFQRLRWPLRSRRHHLQRSR
eukprot:2870569-Lingulodinium_polyedra.AAC.1